MTILASIPALIKVAAVFVLVLIAIRKKISLGNAFLMGAVALGIFFGLSILAILHSFVAAIVEPKTLALAIIVSMILILSNSMESAGQMQRLLKNFRGLLKSPRLNLIVFPALIGLLPMPGGAVFSAPMVKELGAEAKIEPAKLSFINYWFRHIWEYWWPMYPGVLLGTLMADLNLLVFMICLCPLTAAAFYFGGLPVSGAFKFNKAQNSPDRPPLKPFAIELLPILIAIVPGIGLGLIFTHFWPQLNIAKETGLILALIAAILWIWRANRFSSTGIKKIVLNKQTAKMAYLVFAILMFKGVLTDSLAVGAIGLELTQLKVPLFMIAMSLPFIVGMVTGITIAFVGSTFPIIIPLIHAHGQEAFMLAYVMLSLVCGFAGVLLSPLHLCLILSNQYFKASTGEVYRLLWRPSLYLVVLSAIYFGLLHLLGRIG
jgi:uncharacterized protein